MAGADADDDAEKGAASGTAGALPTFSAMAGRGTADGRPLAADSPPKVSTASLRLIVDFSSIISASTLKSR